MSIPLRSNKRVICQIIGTLPEQCCGASEAQFQCEEIAPEGHEHRVGEHTMLHERMGDAYSCAVVEGYIKNSGGLRGWSANGGTRFVKTRGSRL